ncbi:MAG: peptidoglycan DD-metalloendopeptidase family protein [Rubrimonas sp.]|uniref:peptidoglycan DD-metalloendopeptidase family protein n=1 Tax=Rubrimonas sp. TaxID=2036015 RepID=UPI002FDE1C9E
MPEPTSSDRFRLSAALPEKSVLILSGAQARYFRLTPRRQAAALALCAALLLLAGAASGFYLVEKFERADERATLRETTALWRSRVSELETEASQATIARVEAEARTRAAVDALAERHDALSAALRTAQALEARLAEAEARREAAQAQAAEAAQAQAEAGAARAEAEQARARAEADRRELADTLMRVAEALETAAVARDDAMADAEEVQTALGELESSVEERREAQARLLAQIEAAAQASIGSLESVLRGAGVDVDAVLNSLRSAPDGAGGPFLPAPDDAAMIAPEEASAVVAVMSDLERVNLLRAAARKMPFGAPVKAPHRKTSGFGVRRDPVNGRRSMHEGLDFAAPRGTPILAAAEGEVVFAGRQSGYGNVIKIRHAFGFETVYAHLNRIRVAVGKRVRPGMRIGDMGSTGRSTGNHLHYEVRVNGRPVNPSKFIEAARHVDVL